MQVEKLPDLSWRGGKDGSVVVFIPHSSRERMRLPLVARRRRRRIALGCAAAALLGIGVLATGIKLLVGGQLALGILTAIGGLLLACGGIFGVAMTALPPRVESVLLEPQEGREFRVAFAEARVSLGIQPDRGAETQAAQQLWRLAQRLEQRPTRRVAGAEFRRPSREP